jgi:hypothetical protein
MRLVRVILPALVVLLGSCSPPSEQEGALRVRIDTGSAGLRSTCVKLEVRDLSMQPLRLSKGAPLAGRRFIVAGVPRETFPQTVVVQAIGFSGAECTQRTSPDEVSEVKEATFPTLPDTLRDVELTLAPAAVSVDADGDLVPLPQDCDDTDPQVAPGKAEVCTDQKDNDCNQAVDCADTTCAGMQCRGVGSTCAGGRCTEVRCDDGADNDGTEGADCADSDCAGRACRNGGTCTAGACMGAMSEQGLCADGVDNDMNDGTDCVDPDCNGELCSDGRGCTTGERCSNSGCDGGQPVTCAAGTNVCASSMGVCQEPDGGCLYAPLPGDAGCSDGLSCTVNDRCDGDGGCTGEARECTTPPPGDCWEAQGLCDEARDGGCSYTVAVGRLSCSDLDPCSVNDACLVDGGCEGVPLDCSNALPLNECEVSANMCVGGVCQFIARAGACDGGTCSSGVCVPNDAGVFDAGSPDDAGVVDAGSTDAGGPVDAGPDAGQPVDAGGTVDGGAFLAPSNVPLSTITSAPPFAHLDVACSSTISLDPVAITPNALCAAPTLPPATVVPQSNGPSLVVFVVDRLTIRPSVTLRFSGPSNRVPVIAVRGDATLNGVLDVSAVQTVATVSAGPGGGAGCPAPVNGVTDGTASGGGQGGGFGRAGGSGGRGADSGGAGATGMSANGNSTLIPLRGGCNGSRGGGAFSDRFGRAGGAIQVWARNQLVLNGAILASGGFGLSSGVGSPWGSGGGGGGSGGGILVEATSISIGSSALLAANGGGGCEGTGTVLGSLGSSGTNSLNPAPGGTGANVCGGFGGRGGARNGVATDGEEGGLQGQCTDLGGGGGGGGGVGRIRVNALQPCVVAPMARMSPQATSALSSCAP